MKSLTLLIASFCFVASIASAQTSKPTTTAKPPAAATKPAPAKPTTTAKPATKAPANGSLANHYLVKYATAARWNDMEVAKDALYDLIIENPIDSLIFTLAYSYYEDQKYLSSALVAQDYLNRNPKNIDFLQLAAASYEQVGAMERALQAYESLYLLTDATSALYKTAFLQFQLKKNVECLTNIDILLAKADLDKNTAAFEDAEKKQKDYSIRLPLLNLKGMITQETDKVAAKKIFEEALAIAPDFLPAKQSLEKLK
jgi:tetratricopeptide (TPR) repeat protein